MEPSINTIEKLQQLLESRDWSDEDRRWLLQYLENSEGTELKQLLEQEFNSPQQEPLPVADTDRLLNLLHRQINTPAQEKHLLATRWRNRLLVAASVILLAGLATAPFLTHKGNRNIARATPKPVAAPAVIVPGHDNAVLTLADGRMILLDSAANGALARQGITHVTKLNGEVAYSGADETGSEPLYNTISTSRGNQYRLILADGSSIWLNAASSIRFPTAFTGNERRVQVTGEAYFEVAHNPANPFIVEVNGMEIKVLGTHFNVNAYSDEPIMKTTLLEGAVKITRYGGTAVLKPGQQCDADKGGAMQVTSNVDTDEVMAWRNNLFYFNNQPISAIMRQVSRWYDADIAYEGKISKETFSGMVNRNSNISQVLKIMEAGGVKFRIEGKKIIVTQ